MARGDPRVQKHHDTLLSIREIDTLDLYLQCETSREVANRLGIAYSSLRNIKLRIMGKLGVDTWLEALEKWQRGPQGPPDPTSH